MLPRLTPAPFVKRCMDKASCRVVYCVQSWFNATTAALTGLREGDLLNLARLENP